VRIGIETMPERLVIDASAALGILLREPGSEEVQRRLEDTLGGGELLVPGHFWLEVTNVLVRRYACEPDDVVAALRELDEMQLVTVVLDRPAILLGLDLMARHGLTAYDAAYLALAEVADARLLTLDARLAAAAGDRSSVRPRPRTHESLEPYGSPVAVPDWTAHGRYLAELRHAAGGT
jgi:predicted nucleic acid-binding protein